VSGRLAALATAVTDDVSRRSRRAFLLALGAGLLANFALGASILPSAFTANLLLAYALFLGVFAMVLAAVLLQQFGGQFGDALAVGGWSRLEAEARWRGLGASRIPRSPAEAQKWLRDHPDPDALQPQRFAALLLAGDLAGAKATLETCPADTAYERFGIESDRWALDFVEGAIPDLARVEALAAEISDPHEERHAVTTMAILRAHVALAEGSEWVPKMAAVRPLVGDAADGIIGARYVVPAWTMSMAIAALLTGGALVLGRLTGVWR